MIIQFQCRRCWQWFGHLIDGEFCESCYALVQWSRR